MPTIEHRLKAAIQAYKQFFLMPPESIKLQVDYDAAKEEHRPVREEKHFHPLQAIGSVNDFRRLEHLLSISKEHLTRSMLEHEAEKNFNAAFMTKAFFYSFLAEHMEGLRDDQLHMRLMETMAVQDTPYTIVSTNGMRHNNPTSSVYFFLDWDDTIIVRGKPRDKIAEFFHHFNEENKRLGRKRYHFIVTSASFELGKKVERQGRELIESLDAIYSVPVIIRQSRQENKPTLMGKLYTDVCRQLGIPYRRAIILTDQWSDHSVENGYPINTIVTPKNVSADHWINVIEWIEKAGEGDFNNGVEELRRQPYQIVENTTPTKILGKDTSPSSNGATDLIRTYDLGSCALYRTKFSPDCLILDGQPVQFNHIPDTIKKQFANMHHYMKTHPMPQE